MSTRRKVNGALLRVTGRGGLPGRIGTVVTTVAGARNRGPARQYPRELTGFTTSTRHVALPS